jgi:Reverse transcriptase (RNA-dependent DNA polymerase)
LHAFDVVHTDVVGPINPIGRNGHKWAVFYTDDATRARWVRTFKYKREAYHSTIAFVLFVKVQYGADIKMFRLDGGSEYGGQKLLNFLQGRGIRLEPSVPYTPEQNGVSERSNRTIFEKLRSILHDTKAPKNLWPEIIQGIVHVTNRSATAALDDKTPYEALAEDVDHRLNPNATPISFKPSIEHLRVLGCRAIVHIQKQRRTVSEKAEPRAEEGILVGFEGTKIYRVWIPGRRGITRTSTVTFDEESNDELLEVDVIDDAIPYVDENPVTQEPLEFDLGGDSDVAKSDDEAEEGEEPSDDQTGEEPSKYLDSRLQSSRDRPDQSVDLDDSAIRRNPKRGARRPSRYLNLAGAYSSVCDNLKTFVEAMMANTDEPRSYEEAVESGNEWHQAMASEIRALAENNTWELTPYETGMRVLRGKWVYKIKRDSQGNVSRHKARWVVKGYEQRYGIDYEETFASVAKAMALKVLWAFAAQYDLEVEQMDAITAFTQGEVSEEIYVEQPTGFEAGGHGGPKVCRLKRALYGLKQSARLWQEKLSRVLQSLGYTPTSADHCIYRNAETGIVVATYVDDFLIFGPRKDQIDELKAKLHEVLRVEDLGLCQQFLGVKVIRDRRARTVHLVQDQYIERVLKAFQMENSKPMATPIAAGLVPLLVKSTLQASAADIKEFQSALGSLMYAMTQTRPDLGYPVSKLARYSHNPGEIHWKAIRHVFKYLSGTRNLGITYRHTGNDRLDFHGYSDSDHGSCLDTRQSTSGYVFFMAGGPVSWKSARQHSVTLSSTESEYYALTNAAKEASWLRLLLSDLGYSQSDIIPTLLYGDNIPSLQLAENPEHHQRSKHIDIQWHFIRNEVRDKKIMLSHVGTELMAADGLTKILGTVAHRRFIKLLGMESF